MSKMLETYIDIGLFDSDTGSPLITEKASRVASMKILAFLQNQWFKDPVRAKEIFARHPEKRNTLIRLYLFAGCLTGKRLSSTLGDDLCMRIIWEETSPEVGGHSGSQFPADIAHIQAAIEKHSPDVVLAFGKLAESALRELPARDFPVLYGPHPAARNGAVEGLRELRRQLDAYLS